MIDAAQIRALAEQAMDQTVAKGPPAPEASDVDAFQAAMADGQGAGPSGTGPVDPATQTEAAAPAQEVGGVRPLDGTQPAVEPVPGAQATTTEPAAGGTPTLGDRILGMVDQMRTTSSDEGARLQQAVEGLGSDGQVSMQDLLQVQYQMTTYMLQQDLASKTVSKSTQNVETLLKSQ